MEKQIKIKTPDKHLIFGFLSTGKGKNKNLVVFVHGLASSMQEHKFYNAVPYFVPKGFDVFRFDLYSGNTGGRSILECTLETHAKDLDKVIQKFRKEYKKIFVVGHSYGGPTILLSDTSKIDGIAFWDGAYLVPHEAEKVGIIYDTHMDVYRVNWGAEYIFSKEMIDFENKLLTPEELIRNVHVPIKFIVAGNGVLLGRSKKYLKAAHEPKALAVIKGATHNFDEYGTAAELYKETFNWFNKFAAH